ncbi:MAG TPA: TRAM domain-containing protein [Acidimicrobiales bacterium]|nr:TRAM domain-containing protein [Acidimicrobiales bacterium]
MELRVGAMASGGGCMGRAPDGRVVFVRHALPGELVEAEVTEETARFLRADAVAVREPSPDRVVPPCRYAGPGRCGGCDWQHVAVAAQRRLKAEMVAEQLRRVGGVDRAVVVEEVPGAPDGLGWRTRVRFAVDGDGRAGFRRHRSHEVQPVDRCLLAAAEVEGAGVEGRRWPGVDEVEVLGGPGVDGVVTSVAGERRRQVPAAALPDGPGGVVVDGRTVRPPRRVTTEVRGRRFGVSAGVFWQVHPGAPEVLARAVLDALAPRPGEAVADLYAGVGLFAVLLAAAVGESGAVTAVERDRRACADAVANAAGLPQVSVVRSSVTPRLVAGELGHPDLVVLDPAREGAGKPVMAALAGLVPAPRRMAYVSCDAASFARDARVLLDAGWSLASLRAFDLFPMTEHVELLGVLEPPAQGPPLRL